MKDNRVDEYLGAGDSRPASSKERAAAGLTNVVGKTDKSSD